MKIKRMIPVAVLATMVVLFWSFQVGAYGLVSTDGDPGNGNCNQCHTFQGANHTTHTSGGISCASCHGDFSGQVMTSACAVCHTTDGYPDSGLFATHGGLEAPNGDYCGYCHTSVGAEDHNWSTLKNIWE